jgi:hypothetical protein
MSIDFENQIGIISIPTSTTIEIDVDLKYYTPISYSNNDHGVDQERGRYPVCELDRVRQSFSAA